MASRSRTRHDLFDFIRTDRTLRPDGSVYAQQVNVIHSGRSGEQITDVVGSIGDVHPVDHFSWKASDFGLYIGDILDTNLGWRQVFSPNLDFQPFPNGVPSPMLASVLPSSGFVSELGDLAFDAMSTQVPQEVSLPNFLYEMRDIGALVPQLGKSLRETVAGGYLNYQFGWKPFIGDLKKLGSLMDTVSKRIDYLKDTYGRETRLSFEKQLTAADCGIDVLGSSSPPSSGTYIRSWQGTFRCGGYLYHLLNDLDGMQGVLRGCYAALGLNNPLGVLWEATPWSFVADWFGRVDAIAARTAVQPFTGLWEVRRVTHSYSIDFVREQWGGPINGYSPSVMKKEAVVTAKHYLRKTGIPVASGLLTRTNLNSGQLMLAAALTSGAFK